MNKTPVCVEKRIFRVVNARCLARDTVEFDDFEIFAALEIFYRICSQVESAEVKTFVAAADFVNFTFEFFGFYPAAVEKNRASRMRSDVNQRNGFAGFRNVSESFRVALEICVGERDGAFVAQNQSFERRFAVADDKRKTLFGNGEDFSLRLVRKSVIKYAEFFAAREFLHDQVRLRTFDSPPQFFRRFDEENARAAFARVRFEGDGKDEFIIA